MPYYPPYSNPITPTSPQTLDQTAAWTFSGLAATNLLSASNLSWNSDAIIGRVGAASFRFGATAADTTGVSQTLQAQGVTTGGTNNQAGGNLTIASGQGKGNVASSLIFQTTAVGSSGNILQTMTTALTINGSQQSTFTSASFVNSIFQRTTANGGVGIELLNGASNFWILGADASTAGVPNAFVVRYNGTTVSQQYLGINISGGLQLNQYTTAGLLQNDASGNVTTNTAVNAATIPANFIAGNRLTVVISGTTYYIPLTTVAF